MFFHFVCFVNVFLFFEIKREKKGVVGGRESPLEMMLSIDDDDDDGDDDESSLLVLDSSSLFLLERSVFFVSVH